jgi:hypothetical protein
VNWSGKNVFILGASHTTVLGPILRDWIKQSGGTATFVARSGWSTAKYLRDPDWSPGSANVVLVALGTNDDASNYNTYAQVLRGMVNRVRANGAKVIWVGPSVVTAPSHAQRVNAVADAQASILPGLGVQWIDGRQLGTADAADGIHFTRQGYETLARGLYPKLLETPFLTPTTITMLAIAGLLGLVIVRRMSVSKDAEAS